MAITDRRAGAQPPSGGLAYRSAGWRRKPSPGSRTASGILYYVMVRRVRSSQGMSFGQTFAEIPPE